MTKEVLSGVSEEAVDGIGVLADASKASTQWYQSQIPRSCQAYQTSMALHRISLCGIRSSQGRECSCCVMCTLCTQLLPVFPQLALYSVVLYYMCYTLMDAQALVISLIAADPPPSPPLPGLLECCTAWRVSSGCFGVGLWNRVAPSAYTLSAVVSSICCRTMTERLSRSP